MNQKGHSDQPKYPPTLNRRTAAFYELGVRLGQVKTINQWPTRNIRVSWGKQREKRQLHAVVTQLLITWELLTDLFDTSVLLQHGTKIILRIDESTEQALKDDWMSRSYSNSIFQYLVSVAEG